MHGLQFAKVFLTKLTMVDLIHQSFLPPMFFYRTVAESQYGSNKNHVMQVEGI